MKYSRINVIFLTLLLFNSSLGNNLFIQSLPDDQNLPKSICKITNDVISSKNQTQDILIGNLGDKTWSSTVNEIIKCIDGETALVVTDLKTKITEKRLKKSPVVILAGFNQNNHVRVFLY